MSHVELIVQMSRNRIEKELLPGGTSPAVISFLDTLDQLISSTYSAGVKEAQVEQEWSNQSCMGYAIMAAVRIGLDEDMTKKLIADMLHSFDFVCPEEAAAVYSHSNFKL